MILIYINLFFLTAVKKTKIKDWRKTTMLERFNLEVTPDIENQLIQHIREAKALLPFLVDLSIEERLRVPKLSRKNVDFLDRSLLHARSYPQYVPPYIDGTTLAKVVELKDCLYRIYGDLHYLHGIFKDTIMLVESEAYAAARVFYKSVKAAAKEGGADAEIIAKDLAYHYKKKRIDKQEIDADETGPQAG